MSYSFVRHINPAIAGFGALGDYATQYAAWKVDHGKWATEAAAYITAKKIWAGVVTNLKAQYTAKVTDYQNDLKKWNNEATAYSAAMTSRAASIAATTANNKAKSAVIAKQWSLKLPADYTGCVLQFWHDEWVRQCTESKRTTVMGLGIFGGLGATPTSWGHSCGTSLLPICGPAPGMPYLRPKPVAPPVLILPPEPTLRAEPQAPKAPPAVPPPPPVVVTTPPPGGPSLPPPPPPVVVTTPPPVPPPTVEEEPNRQANMIKGGLLAVVVVGGGYLLYRTFKKPKAKAA